MATATKSDKLKKKMAMIAKEREEYELQKQAMKSDIEYMGQKERDITDNSSSRKYPSHNEDEFSIKMLPKAKHTESASSRKAEDDDSDTPSSVKRFRKRRKSHSAVTGAGSYNRVSPHVSQTTSSTELSFNSSTSEHPHPVPSGKKISDWCYSADPNSIPPVIKGQQNLYVDVRFLGRGAYGTVDLIKNKEENKLYAVKTLLVKGKDDQKAFLHEVKYLRNRHPFIIHLHDAFITTQPKKVYLVMHYCEGGDLGKVISMAVKGKQPITEVQIFKWLSQISLAIDHLHNLRVVHRDIKPPNILLSDSGEVAQLSDFGLATQIADTEDHFESCEVGTPYYTAPEMINSEPCSFPVDMWSLGIVLFELLALDMPFDGEDTMALVRCILSDNYRIDLIPKIYSAELLSILEGLLCKDSHRRMTSNQLLIDPGLVSKVAQLPSSYKPKYLEERLKRAHVKQLTRQLENLGIRPIAHSTNPSTCNSPMSSSIKNLSPKSNSSLIGRSSVSDSNKTRSPKSSTHFDFHVINEDVPSKPNASVLRPQSNISSPSRKLIEGNGINPHGDSSNDEHINPVNSDINSGNVRNEKYKEVKNLAALEVHDNSKENQVIGDISEVVGANSLQNASVAVKLEKCSSQSDNRSSENVNVLHNSKQHGIGMELSNENLTNVEMRDSEKFYDSALREKYNDVTFSITAERVVESVIAQITTTIAPQLKGSYIADAQNFTSKTDSVKGNEIENNRNTDNSFAQDSGKTIASKTGEMQTKKERIGNSSTDTDVKTRLPTILAKSRRSEENVQNLLSENSNMGTVSSVTRLPDLVPHRTISSPLLQRSDDRRHSTLSQCNERKSTSQESDDSPAIRRCKSGTTQVVDVLFLKEQTVEQ